MHERKDAVNKLEQVFGGEWRETLGKDGVKGYKAGFPQFKAHAVVGVLNDLAKQAGSHKHAFSTGTFPLGDPNMPHDVVVPAELMATPAFLNLLTPQVMRTVTQVMAQQFSHAAMTGLLR